MTRFIALLRGVNVGGHRKLPMAELRVRLEELGYREARTLLASGNVVFESKSTKPAVLEKKLEADLARTMGLTTEVMIRDPKEWEAIIRGNPFPKEAVDDPSHFLVTVLKKEPPKRAVDALLGSHEGPEKLEVRGREIYVVYGEGMADSRLNLKGLGSGTARNWNTVLKLRAMVDE